ncbi:metal ABC transporter permease [Paracoccus sp. (in: a-proteobacteria)]|uniref:metal ABC transporter permease n=1 Tax=Paracoccus sp. TaxID=267 RepID=UPI0026DFC8B5|nr:metal ABC transporter permease [Paracoccus sp. (in: a-proteobacteria)]MDO5648005.1 metal ABC transporter permease [Paracoccus sp. (in: a-proteobacteria)]
MDLLDALFLRAGYNAALVAVGAALLGMAAGAVGAFMFLRKRALVSDAVAHAALPGVCAAFLIMVAMGRDGRSLIGLLAGAAASAAIGLWLIEWATRRTRLTEDAAIGAVLGAFFGLGVVLMTVIQTVPQGRQAGIETFLLGSAAGMLFEDSLVIAIGGGVPVALIWLLRRPMILTAFDPSYAAALGVNVAWVDRALMGLVMVVTVVGLKLVGLILIVAMLIIPPVTARFWTDRSSRLVGLSGAIGGLAAWIGAALSSVAPALPTGPVVVLVAALIFALSLVMAPRRGIVAGWMRHVRLRRQMALRAALRDMVPGSPVPPALRGPLQRRGLVDARGLPTDEGLAQAADIAQDGRRWVAARRLFDDAGIAPRDDGLTRITSVLTPDQIAQIDGVLAQGGKP